MKDKIKRSIGIFFLMISLVICMMVPISITVNAEDNGTEFDLLGKTFSGTNGSTNSPCTLEFYSQQYNSTQDTCLKLTDGRDGTTYIYFNYRLWNSTTCTLEAYTSAVTGAWSSYAPLSITGKWENNKFSFKISISNGVTVCFGDFDLVESETDPDTPELGEDDTSNYEFSLSGERFYFEGKEGTLNLNYESAVKGNVLDELKSIRWNNSNPEVAEVEGLDVGIADSDNNRATVMATVNAKNVGTTKITGTSPDNRTANIDIIVEPQLNIESQSSITLSTSIVCKVEISNENTTYLERYMKNISYSIENISGGEIEIENEYYRISDDGKSATYILDVKPNKLGAVRIVFSSENGQVVEKEIEIKELLDSDGDGLLDVWEINGVDIDGDGESELDLPSMGADPNKPDIFVEIDWMSNERIDLKPSSSALKIVYDQFAAHGINLHLDAGPDSVDFVTLKKWGNLSGGNSLEYASNFNLGNNRENWAELVNKNFSSNRINVFRYCIFLNR